MEAGSFVTIKADKKKIVYKILEKNNNLATIVGLNYRIKQVIDLEDLEIASNNEVASENERTQKYHDKIIQGNGKRGLKYALGTLLHLDGDKDYLDKCLQLYKTLGVYAYGVCYNEKEMATKLKNILTKINPDIIVITGHDAYNNKGKKDLDNYINSRNFMNAVLISRQLCANAIIIAGACQSNYEALIASGANFASSPKRINVHTFDPAVIAIKAATTSITRIINFDEATKYIENERDAFGGVETFGKMRMFL